MLKHLRKRIRQRKLRNARWLATALGMAVAVILQFACLPPKTYAEDLSGLLTADKILLEDSNIVSGDTFDTNAHTLTNSFELYNYGALTNSGTLYNYDWLGNSGTLYNSGTLDNSGWVATSSWYTLYNSGTLINSNVIYNYLHAILENTGMLINSGYLYNWGMLANSGIITNTGTLTIGFGGTLTNSGAIINNGILTNGYGGILNITGGTVAGNAITSDGDIYVSGGTVSADIVLNGGTMTVSGGTISGAITNSATLNVSGGTFRAAAVRNLSITTLGGSATFYMDTNLAAGTYGLITVAGAADGSHYLYVANSGGTPASTYQVYKLVDLTGAPANTAVFSGYGDVGAFRYNVASGSAIEALASSYSGIGAATEDYYLYNTFAPSAASRAIMSLAADNVVVWYGEMNEIKKRLGDLRVGSQSADDFWVRTYAGKYSVRPGGGYDYSQIMRGVELGKDNPQSFAGGKKYTGFVLGTGKASDAFSGAAGTTDSTYVGAYASWLRNDGAYVDLVGKYNRFSHRFDSANDSGKYGNNALGLSAEIGKRFERANGFFIEPAMEVAALWANKASFTTANGLAGDAPAIDSRQLRLGVTAGRKWQGGDGANRQFYGKVSWINEYKGDSTVRVDSAVFDSSLQGHQWLAGIGFIEDGKHHQLYLDAEKSWGNVTSKQWGVNAGYRWKF